MEPAQEKDSDNEPRVSSENATVISVGDTSGKAGERAVASQRKRECGFVPIPKWLRYDPERPAHFGLLLNAVFGFASTFVVANLYYCQPLLIQFSLSFDVTYEEVSR